jgi:hypothetical protein
VFGGLAFRFYVAPAGACNFMGTRIYKQFGPTDLLVRQFGGIEASGESAAQGSFLDCGEGHAGKMPTVPEPPIGHAAFRRGYRVRRAGLGWEYVGVVLRKLRVTGVMKKAVEDYRSPRRFANFFRSSVSIKVL